jgi:hypothetical protein
MAACNVQHATWATRVTWATWAGHLHPSTCTLVSRTPAKRETVRDVKKKGYLPVLGLVLVLGSCLLPNHWKCLEVTGGHSAGHGEGHGAHPDRVGAADTMGPFIT